MAESITLQTSDNNVQQLDVLGRLSFAASNESSGSDARLIAASIYAVAESDFTEISNATSLIFATASSENASEVMRITSVGDVGIGTFSPSSKLEIVGGGGTSDSGILTISDPNSGGGTTSWIKLYADDGFGDLTWHVAYSDTTIFKALEFRTAFNNAPEVIIEPSGEFLVSSDKSVYTYRYLSGKTRFNTASQPAYTWSMDENTGMFSPTDDAIAFSTGGIERMRIDSDQVVVNSGNIIFNEIGGNFDFRVEGDSDENLLSVDASLDRVGIGILVPQAKLDVRGSFLANNVVTLGSGSIPLPRRPIEILNHTNIDQLSIRLRQNAQGKWVSGYSFPTVAGLSGQALVADSSGVVSWSSVALGSGISNYVPKWINSTTLTSGLIYDDGNHIGIGNNPNGHLDSFSTYGPSLVLGNGSGDVGQFFYSTNNASIWFTNGTELNNLRGQITYLHSENKLAFGTSGVGISMALDANGNLGIGQNYPSARLNVEGGNIVFNDLGGNFDFRVEGDTDQNLLFVDASTDRVGIGTSSPTHKLHVAGSGYMDWTQLQSNYYINYPIPGSIAGNSNRDQIILFAQNGVATLFRGYIDSNSTATSNEYLRNFSRTFIHYRTSATVDTVPQVTVNGVYNGNQSDLAANDNGRVVKVLHNGVEYWGLIMQDLSAFQNPGAPVFNGYASSLTSLQYGFRDGFTTVTDITPNATAGRSASLFRYQNLSVPDGNVGVGTNNPTSRLHVEGGNVVFNDVGGNFDFRVEGDTDANLLFVDASNDSINIGTGSSTGSKLYVSTNSATNYSSILASGAAGSQSSLIRVSNINNSIDDSLAGLFISVRQPSTSTDQSAFISCLSSTEHVHTPHIVFGSRSGSSTFQELMRISSSGNFGIGTNSPTEKLDINSDAIRIRTAQTPASGTATGNAGDICWDSNYIYVCVATNTWKRSSLASW